jgi:Tn3 transposase DDE domain
MAAVSLLCGGNRRLDGCYRENPVALERRRARTEYLPSQETQYEVQEGLNVVENWNATNDFICYGRQGELATS